MEPLTQSSWQMPLLPCFITAFPHTLPPLISSTTPGGQQGRRITEVAHFALGDLAQDAGMLKGLLASVLGMDPDPRQDFEVLLVQCGYRQVCLQGRGGDE